MAYVLCLGLFALSLDVIGRLCSVILTLSEHLLSNFYVSVPFRFGHCVFVGILFCGIISAYSKLIRRFGKSMFRDCNNLNIPIFV